MNFFHFRFVPSIFIVLFILTSCSTVEYENLEVIDGDTLSYNEGIKVRLVQIDTPEIQENECYAQDARNELVQILVGLENDSQVVYKGEAPKPSISFERDDVSGDKDKYDRELRYLFVDNLNVNLELVKRGAAAPYFYRGQKGKYAVELLVAAQLAKDSNLGLWGACPGTELNPNEGVNTTTSYSQQNGNNEFVGGIASGGSNCDPNYEGCVPSYPPDLDCPDIRALGLAPVRRIGGDPHRLDRDGDGVGCE